MAARRGWLWVGLLCLGLRPPLVTAEPVPAVSPAQRSWEDGQRAMEDGKTDLAIASYQQSLRLDPTLASNHLSLAAAYLDKGQDELAVPHLARYVEARPDHFIVRAHYAELLLRLERPREARAQFERFIADIQDHSALAQEHLVHCHSRVMAIAEAGDDAYTEHLHRGIGLYLLASQRSRLLDSEGELSVEGLLCKAAGELLRARRLEPEEARPCWYLHEVWSGLAQRQPATHWLRAAQSAAPFTYLTPTERTALHLACRRCLSEGQRK